MFDRVVVREVLYESTIEIGEANKTPQFFEVSWFWPFCDCLYLSGVHTDLPVTDDHAEVFNFSALKFAFLWSQI